MTRITIARQKQFISGRYPAWASLAPMFLFLLVGITAGTTQLRFRQVVNSPDRLDRVDPIMMSFFAFNGAATLFALLVTAIPCQNLR
jgi:hypothetical protein